ncbi:Putative ER transporter, 6TM [Septoria linicola]|uniref:ER transporter, 6TM n=1 Tax=Septoria linicola TaxID=215465 RepID=A0A9Q9AJY4_9PEZI|nr:putative ER transporter, 6TM [Septoria linicola]USW47533.1 Putative ER transporter, 6TM [Septoria linicola]
MANQQNVEPDRAATEKSSNGKPTESSNTTESAPDQKSNKFKALWIKLDLDLPTVLMMFKASLPPTIAIAMYQSQAVAGVYSTLGYLIAITSVMGMCIMPRGMFVQTITLNVLAVCIGAAVCLLALYCGIQARLHTTATGSPPTGYNSSSSAVLAVWLFFQTYLVNVLRGALPQYQFPVIIYSIFASVSLTYGTQFPSMTYALSFMQRLIEAFLTGFAIATGVSFLVFPVSSRKVVFKEFEGYLNGLGGLLKLQATYLSSLETWELEAGKSKPAMNSQDAKARKKHRPIMMTAAGQKLKETLRKIYDLHTKLPSDIAFAKREIAFGKLSPRDITEIWKRMRFILVPIAGLSSILDILQRRAEESGWQNQYVGEAEVKARRRQIDDLHHLMKSLHEPVATQGASLHGAFQHVLITLELIKPPKKASADEESSGSEPLPGTPGFANAYRGQLQRFYDSKQQTLEDWCHQHGIEIPPNFFDSTFVQPEHYNAHNEHARERNQRQLFFALYVHHLLWKAGQAALELVLYADQRKQEGALTKTRFIVPQAKTFRKWARAAIGKEDLHDENLLTADLTAGRVLDLGESFGKSKDPEHFPARNTWERMGEAIRLIPRAFRSDASAFGFRVACATMSIAIICYLGDSQTWFLENRLLWAMIMVPISMTRTAGQSTWSFALRIAGTFIAMVASYIIWYIVDGHTAGVIVFLWLWMFLAFYILLKQKTLLIAGIISIVTAILVIGYELQTRVVGVEVSESNGQPAYPTYLLAPYRLATVCGGLAVAYIWTIFPYPVSESTELRKDVGAALYMLANLSSVVHELVRSRVQKIDGDESAKGTRAFHLEKARNQVFTKTLSLLTTLQQNSAFSKFQIRVGGRFPHEEYTGLIESIQRVLQYTSLIAYASRTFSATEADSEWSVDFRKLLGGVNATSHRLTSLLALLSSSITDGKALPPHLDIPQHARYVKNLEAIDRDILSVRHIAEPEYSAFAVIQICAQCINDDVVKITRHVKTLVGTIDFTFHSKERNSSDDSSVDSAEDEKAGDV